MTLTSQISGRDLKLYSKPCLQIGGGADAAKLGGEGPHGGALLLEQLLQHKVQQAGLAVRALHVRQLQQGVQLEACIT